MGQRMRRYIHCFGTSSSGRNLGAAGRVGWLMEVHEQVRVGCQAYIVYLVDKESLAPFIFLLCALM